MSRVAEGHFRRKREAPLILRGSTAQFRGHPRTWTSDRFLISSGHLRAEAPSSGDSPLLMCARSARSAQALFVGSRCPAARVTVEAGGRTLIGPSRVCVLPTRCWCLGGSHRTCVMEY